MEAKIVEMAMDRLELQRLREECKLADQRTENQSRFHDCQLRTTIAAIEDNTGERLKVVYEDNSPYEFWTEDGEDEEADQQQSAR
jgi:hypothetical protein